jgi:hypothetical protein
MQLFQTVLVEGWRKATRNWRASLPLYLSGLLLGLAQTWPLLLAGGQALYNPFLGELAAGGGAALDLLLSDPLRASATASIWVIVTLLFTLLFGLAYSFFSGGALSVFAGTLPFWAGCRRTFWTFAGLGLLVALLAFLAIVLAAFASALIGLAGAAVVLLALLQLINLLGEYARALAVVWQRRNPFALLGMALSFFRRNPAGVLGLAAIGVLLQGALAALYTLGSRAVGGTPLAILWQQLAVLGWIWVKLLRLAWAVSYVQASARPSVASAAVDATSS